MTDKLPPNLLALFAPRPPLRWVPPSDHAPEDRKTAAISGLASFLPALEEYKETDVYEPTESWLQKKDRKQLEKKSNHEALLRDGPANYKPSEDPNIRGDAFKTIIVARLSYDATEQDLEAHFGRYGPIERIRIVVDSHQAPDSKKKKKKHRGYAFVVYEREKDMRAALQESDGIRIKDRRIKVDVERGRTVKGWKPRRLGGGLGGRGYTKAPAPRPAGGFNGPPGGPGGFQGGGFRGGFDGGRGRGGFRGGRGGGNFQDRGGFSGGRGGVGYQSGGGFQPRGGYGGDRGGGGGGYSAPAGAPAGPGGGGRGSYGGSTGGYGGRGGYGAGSPDRNGSAPIGVAAAVGGGYESRNGGRSYDDRSASGGYRGSSSRGYGDRGGSGSNMEPVRPRENGGRENGGRENGGYRDQDRGYSSRPRDDDAPRKRGYDDLGSGPQYQEDPRKIRRY